MSRAKRLARIEELLLQNVQGMRVVEIAALCGVDRRTIYRDLLVLEDEGLPLRQEDGRYSIVREHYRMPLRIDYQEAVLLFLAAQLLARGALRHNPHLLSVIKKLGSVLNDPLQAFVNTTVAKLQTAAEDAALTSILETLSLAWMERRKVRFWYSEKPDEESARYDLSLFFIDVSTLGELVAVGRGGSSAEVGVFSLRHIQRLRVLDEAADPVDAAVLDNWSVSRYLRSGKTAQV